MSDLDLTAEARAAMLAGLVAKADLTGTASRIDVYGTTKPVTPGGAAGGSPLVTIVLTDPCGSVTDGVLSLTQADVLGDLISTTGTAVWARWKSGDGSILADGLVTDEVGAGPFKLRGTTGNNLYAGGRAVLGAVALT